MSVIPNDKSDGDIPLFWRAEDLGHSDRLVPALRGRRRAHGRVLHVSSGILDQGGHA